ncbi:hypothetical protein [Antarctobacter jejuensis]|uniref:hypothetical protein n=1 Tax=Antarctobacter jejuensis TaxID=1439938 RepID=UPI003FD517E5
MPLTLNVLPELELVHADYIGRTTLGDIVRAYSELLEHPEIARIRLGLNDLRGLCKLDVFYEGMTHLAGMISADSAERPLPWCTAIVVNQQSMHPHLDAFMREAKRHGTIRTERFRDIAGAVDWLGLSPGFLDHRLPCGRVIRDPHGRDQSIAGTT